MSNPKGSDGVSQAPLRGMGGVADASSMPYSMMCQVLFDAHGILLSALDKVVARASACCKLEPLLSFDDLSV